MKVNIKKITLFVIALAAAYYMVPAQALTRKELQSRESAIEKFLTNSKLAAKDRVAYSALVEKLRGTMSAHKIPQYQQLFDTIVQANEAGVLVQALDIEKNAKDSIKKALDAAKQETLDAQRTKDEGLEKLSDLAKHLAIVLIDAFRTNANFSDPATSNKYKAALRAFVKESWGGVVPVKRDDFIELTGVNSDFTTPHADTTNFNVGDVVNILNDK